MSLHAQVATQYDREGLLARIESGLAASGKSRDRLSVDDLAAVDAFHTRGRAATCELADLAELTVADHVLDVGCGLGGTARFLADRFGCRVSGLDLTESYVAVGQQLTRRVGLSDQVDLRSGTALELPYEHHVFDVVWTEHVQMNVADKDRFYDQISRVLKRGGRFLFHDVFRGSQQPVRYPVPWADDASISFLASPDQIKEILANASFNLQLWTDQTAASIEFFERLLRREAVPPLGIHLLLGENAQSKLQNYVQNLRDDRVCVAMGRATRD